jgi:hypothetical protein
MQGLPEVLKIVIAFLGKTLLWVLEALLWLKAAAEGIDNLVTAVVALAIIVFGPGLWLAKHLREKDEKARTDAELQRAWDAAHQLTVEEEEALRIIEDEGQGPRKDPARPDEFQELRDYLTAMGQELGEGKRK